MAGARAGVSFSSAVTVLCARRSVNLSRARAASVARELAHLDGAARLDHGVSLEQAQASSMESALTRM